MSLTDDTAVEGVLVVDKPQGPTSHDVVAVARRQLGQRQIGHTGTLDPLATGVLPLACGRATRLVRFLTGADKTYDATIRFGLETDTYDVTGREVAASPLVPTLAAVTEAFTRLRGDYLQAPPPVSAKKVGGRRAYDLARAGDPVQPAPVPVSVRQLDLISLDGVVATVRVTCSAGFYIRSLAHAAGQDVGTGACLATLRRTRSGIFGLADAVTLDLLGQDPGAARERMIPLARLLPDFPAAVVTPEGQRWLSHGLEIGRAQVAGRWPDAVPWVRLVGQDGNLLALATGRREGFLHPSVVLM